MSAPTYSVDIVLAKVTNETECVSMNYCHNVSGLSAAANASKAIADWEEEDTTIPTRFRSVLVAVNVTVHDVRVCRFCQKEN